MAQYESLEKLHFKGENVVEEYQKRIENCCTYNTELKIYPILRGERVVKEQYSLFCLPINEINLLQEKIFLNSKEIMELDSELPAAAKFACINDIMTNEITKTNGIEGVHSTKKEIYESMDQKKTTRYSGIVNKYTQIILNNVENIDSPEQIRKMYDDIFLEDILKNPENKLDGTLFRKGRINVSNGASSIFEDRKKYAELFLNTSKVKNYGEVTFFVIGMLNFIVNGQESIIQMLKDKILKLNYAEKYIDSIETSYSLSEIECNILFIYIQNYIFAKENPLPDKELLKYVKGIKSIQTLRRHLDNLTTLDLITLVSKKPLIRTISNTIKEVLD